MWTGQNCLFVLKGAFQTRTILSYKKMYDRHLVANRRNNAGTFCFDSVFTDLGFHLGKEATHTVLTTSIGTPSICIYYDSTVWKHLRQINKRGEQEGYIKKVMPIKSQHNYPSF